ncbi:AraC family transcriptional regulator [Hyphomicrobium sp. D-2]|uniref:AraC family transcriptional regulator n=1 Tax=Hyphomicrobium sp. D-2 TaxID=3041621 RepID=UPI0024555C92|nr:AraC family transcriptional regulator [Hyphomicrobium sp. D-2]MDH4981868.1 AraC family transcriptional regulator [Hyphomicrobium sp. D-2]
MKSYEDLPRLAFGHTRAAKFRDADSMSEALAGMGSLEMKHRSAEADGSFRAQTAVIKTRSVRLVALASSAFHVEAQGAPSGLLMVPLHGFTTTQHDGRTFEWGTDQGALYLPPGGCSARSTARSVIGIDVDRAEFDRVTQVMLGGRPLARGSAFSFSRPCPVKLPRTGVDFCRVIDSLAATMDLFEGDEHLIARAALDDAIIRVVALLLNFDAFSASAPDAGAPRAVLRLACEYIDANLTSTITLTELESITGLSRRSLQYAFRAAFDCTPMQWVAQRRLEAVRNHILAAREGENLTTIAGEYFANLGEFARMYKQRYGELPSTALKQAIAKRLRS